MASRGDSAGSSRPRSRRSIAHVSRSRLTSGGDKENATADVGASRPLAGRQAVMTKEKKSRSRSLGPGGLDALQDSNGNRRKSAAVLPLKSILKPTAPVSPVRSIPTFEETRRKTPAQGAKEQESINSSAQEGLLIDLDTPAQQSAAKPDDQTNPFDTFNASTIRDDMAAAREQEEKERRERERKAALEHREARRKSMANRRVSFAPEATLHTWNVVEIPDDSTSSSASNSTRRASSLTNDQNQQPTPTPKQSEQPSSPEIEVDSDIAFSPVQYPDLEQFRNQSASCGYDGIGSSHDMSSSPFSGSENSEDTGLHSIARDEEEDDASSSGSGFDGDSTAMSMDDMSVHSGVTAQTDGSESTTGTSRLNEALRQAAREAGTRSIDDEDNEEVSMEIADQEITGAFQPWIKKGQRQSFDWEDISARHDQENVDPAKPSNTLLSETASDNGEEDLSMEVTNAIGRIFPNNSQSVGHRRSTGAETNYEEQTMELTNVVGGIAHPVSPAKSVGATSDINNDEEMTMEFTSVVGGVLNGGSSSRDEENNGTPSQDQNDSEWHSLEDDVEDGADMEITGAVGGILPAIQEQTESMDGDETAGMDFTAAMGKILTPGHASPDKADLQLGSSPFQETVRASPSRSSAKSPAAFQIAAVASESGSPSLASVRSRRTRQSLGPTTPTTPTSMIPQESPTKNASVPATQLALTGRPSTPGQTPPSRTEDFGSGSPQKLFDPAIQVSDSQQKSPGRRSLFGHNAAGESAPLFVLRPPGARRSSGLGIDREGLGSPKVAAMLDKRRSIGEEAGEFVPQDKRPQGVRFEDPIKLQEEVDREREEEEGREDGHIQPPNDRDHTASLRDMISSLTPKKNKVRGRKSLHVGTARGLLGKRPAELDLDDEDEAENTPKRLRRREDMSPVKNVKLPPPPTKEETVGRPARSPARRTFDVSPPKLSTTPTQEPRSVSALTNSAQNESDQPAPLTDAENMVTEDVADEGPEPELEPIQLQDFLNMTNIHFMELTTTKRRHTTAPDSISKRAARLSLEGGGKSSASNFDDCVAAGFCTVPMLELYQHSCRELKSYISEGRQIIRSIETETYADNPPLFREYMTAAPDIRLLMDNQFRNVKTHTRLLSKATWYEWRMKLLEGLKEGLDHHMEEMKEDDKVLSKHETLLNGVVPALATKHSSLEREATNLQQLADELENCDQDELWGARGKLADIEEEIASKKQLLQELQVEIQDKTDTIETGAELKAEFTAQIQEAERVKEECRGWSAKEIRELKSSVHRIEQQTGWSVSSASPSESEAGPVVTMSYRYQLQLKFHPGSFYLGNDNKDSLLDSKTGTLIELTYCPQNETRSIQALSPVAVLVLKSLQTHVATINQSKLTPKQLLRFVSGAWDLASNAEEEARMLGFQGVTNLRLSETDKPSLRARCTLIGAVPPPDSALEKLHQTTSNSRIDVDFAVTTRILEKKSENEIGVMDIQTEVIASKVYGFGTDNDTGLSEKEMRSILSKELRGYDKSGVKFGSGVWSKAVQMLSGKVF